ncbi:hypothetical protein V1264_015887 [Littorina saxatilis]
MKRTSEMEKATLNQCVNTTENKGKLASPLHEKQGHHVNDIHNQRERKRFSEPISTVGLECKSRFERHRMWTQSKQDSFEAPEEFKCPTEDNVFSDTFKNKMGRAVMHRRMSEPAVAVLPDVIPEPHCESGNNSPDVLSNSNKEDHASHPPVKPILTSGTSKDSEVRDFMERKKGFEGPVCYEPMHIDPLPEVKRKKSVSFETAVKIVRVLSDKGQEARHGFRGLCSSGYGSQSDCSQQSTTSNISSEQGSMMSDDVLEDGRSFETDDGKPCSVDGYSGTSTGMDGSTDGSDEEHGAVEPSSKQTTNPAGSAQEKCQHASTLAEGSCHASGEKAEEVVDETELWQRQMSPKFGVPSEEDLPHLSIFEISIAGEDFLDHRHQVLDPDIERGDLALASQSLTNINGPGSGVDTATAENSENKTSPTTKEECQRDLFKRLFEERMLKFDPAKESLSDLLDWFKNNIGEALTPSPKSPFFALEEQRQKQRCRGAQQAATTVIQQQGMGLVGGTDLRGHLAQVGTEEKGSQSTKAGWHENINCATQSPTCPYLLQLGTQQNSTFWMQVAPYVQANINRGQPAPQPQLHPPLYNIPGAQPRGSMNMKPPAAQYQPGPASHSHNIPGAQPGPYSHNKVHPGQPAPPGQAFNPLMPGSAPTGPDNYCQGPLPNNLLPTSLYSSVDIGSDKSSISTGVRDSLLEELGVLAQCGDSKCSEPTCQQGRRRLHSLKEALKKGPSDHSADDIRFMELLREHYKSCDQPNCNVPWCRFITQQCQGGEQKTLQELSTLLSNPLHTFLPAKAKFNHFVQLDPSLELYVMPQEWKDWVLLCPLSDSFSVARVIIPRIPLWPRRHWVVKMTSLHEGENQLEMLEKLRGLRHRHIIEHNWAASDSNQQLLVICTDFLPGLSVTDLLDQFGALPLTQARRYLQQILDAVSFIHSHDIVYLNWACSNLLLDQSCETVKMSNFTMSVSLPGLNADIGAVKLSLPADVVPTELLTNDGVVTHDSDSWGLACVLHEMLVGVRPWYHLRHQRQEEIWRQILLQIPPILSKTLPQNTQLLMQACLQRNPSSRLSVEKIKERLG